MADGGWTASRLQLAQLEQFLEAHGWTVEELLYFGPNHVVYTASQTGDTKAMHYKRGSSLQ
jgi:hypothetical protein